MTDHAKVERSRTFTGCRTCRDRHLKCDEAQPVCNTCQRLGLNCAGYGPRLFWAPDTVIKRPRREQKRRCTVYRFPLFSEQDRSSMTRQLSESLGSKTAKQILADIELSCERLKDDGKSVSGLFQGPFGAFQASAPVPPTSHSSESRSPSLDASIEADSSPQEPSAIEPEVFPEPWIDDFEQPDLEQFINSLDCSGVLKSQCNDLDYAFLASEPSAQMLMPDEQFEGGVNELPPLPDFDALLHPMDLLPNVENEITDENMDVVAGSRNPTVSKVSVPAPISTSPSSVPEHAECLLRRYKKYLENNMTIHAQRKSPWQIILLPCALETFAGLFIFNGASHTRLAIFYELLSQAAFQLQASSEPPTFPESLRDIGIRYQDLASHHLRIALDKEVFGENQAKYQELLMAVLAMAMISIYNGRKAFKTLLMDAARLIRLRGLSEKKSFEIRVVHHMYTHLRVMAESLWLPSSSSTVVQDTDTISPLSCGDFRITENSLNIGLDPMEEKSCEVAHNDIHLEIQGRWTETLYADIYGVPESLMTLLSQTIFFANEKVRLTVVARGDARISMAISHHIKTLEDTVLSWSLDMERTNLGREVADLPHLQYITTAIHSAIIIYFYRRIYNLNAKMLQDLVRKTLDNLEPCLQQTVHDSDFAMTLAWPAFIAACEAMTTDLQERALKCLAITDCRDFFLTSRPATELVKKVWDTRAKEGDWALNWLEIIQDIKS